MAQVHYLAFVHIEFHFPFFLPIPGLYLGLLVVHCSLACHAICFSFLLVTIRLNNLLSSANRLKDERTPRGRSFINIKNRIGPNTDPCGTPLVTFMAGDAVPLITTLWVLSLKKSFTQSKI
ncbi:unnamed protein product [Meganyctiphanes norvegica]|uniref:Uncharacterized protein n=1 Tax=Meganyctiphanes norvegica TaxID=48144 RepID=A0AAV2SU01_MEGNR